jgi:ABC-2 type transport system permease protein
MKLLRIFLLYFQIIFTERGRSFVWFLSAFIPPFALYVYWRGALVSSGKDIAGWTISAISTYYFMIAIMSSFLMAHIEEDVAGPDIQRGELVSYILKPFPYYFFKFFLEIPYRILQGSYGLIVLFIFTIFFHGAFSVTTDVITLIFAVVIIILAFFLSFTFKMSVGIAAFWLTDIRGFNQLVEALILIFGGFLLPLSLLPNIFAQIAYFLPFSYMIYFPIVVLQGGQTIIHLIQIIAMQIIWLLILIDLYILLWKIGIKKFTGVGQ